MNRAPRAVAALAAAALLAGCADAPQLAGPSRAPDVIYVRTPQAAVEEMLRLAEVREGDVLYDLGSGDGRIPITAARKHGVVAVGIEIDPRHVAAARQRAERRGVERLATFRVGDIFEADFREASVVTLFLLPHLNLKLRDRLLRDLKPGTRIVSYRWDMGDWKPERSAAVPGGYVYLWRVPDKGRL